MLFDILGFEIVEDIVKVTPLFNSIHTGLLSIFSNGFVLVFLLNLPIIVDEKNSMPVLSKKNAF